MVKLTLNYMPNTTKIGYITPSDAQLEALAQFYRLYLKESPQTLIQVNRNINSIKQIVNRYLTAIKPF